MCGIHVFKPIVVLKNSGGTVTDLDGKEILYGKNGFKNPGIILKSTADL